MPYSNIDAFREHVAAYNKGQRRGLFSRLRSGRNSGLRFPWFTMLNVLMIGFIFKAFVMFDLGKDQYAARLAAVDDSRLSGKIGVFILSQDPVTENLHAAAKKVLGKSAR